MKFTIVYRLSLSSEFPSGLELLEDMSDTNADAQGVLVCGSIIEALIVSNTRASNIYRISCAVDDSALL